MWPNLVDHRLVRRLSRRVMVSVTLHALKCTFFFFYFFFFLYSAKWSIFFCVSLFNSATVCSVQVYINRHWWSGRYWAARYDAKLLNFSHRLWETINFFFFFLLPLFLSLFIYLFLLHLWRSSLNAFLWAGRWLRRHRRAIQHNSNAKVNWWLLIGRPQLH